MRERRELLLWSKFLLEVGLVFLTGEDFLMSLSTESNEAIEIFIRNK